MTNLPSYQGYVDAVTDQHVAGWVRDLADAAEKVSVEVALDTTNEVLARGRADAYLPELRAIGGGDGEHGFNFRLPRRLTQQEQDAVVIRPLPDGAPLTRSDYLVTQYNLAAYQGYVDAVTEQHVAGWVRDLANEAGKVAVEVRLDTTGEVLLQGKAAAYLPRLRAIGGGDGEYAFNFRLPRRLTQQEQDAVVIRPLPDGAPLTRSDYLVTQYNPIKHIIMDVVDNCNLRCPFCVYDYNGTHITHTMTEATFDAVVRFAPYVTDGNFWFSCLHEPTLHPRLVEFIDKVPPTYRSKLFYTTNLAKRMPPSYFEALADSGMHHINISIESLDPTIYEKMRKGARFRIFKENWDHLVDALGRGSAPPKLRYISLAYKSTFRQLPALIDYLLHERSGSIVEVRHTYDEPHIPRAFRQAEYLGREDWLWLREQLAHHTAEEVMLVLPPGLENPAFDHEAAAWSEDVASKYELSGPAPSAIHAVAPEPFHGPLPKGFQSRHYGFRVFWDGRLEVTAIWGEPNEPAPPELRLRTTNVCEIDDVDAFLGSLPF